MIIDDIKKDNIEAMKNKDQVRRAIYSVVVNKYMCANIDARTTGKSVDDDAVVRIIQKTIKELIEEQENYRKVNNEEEVSNIGKQIETLNKYLPQMMSKEEIEKIYNELEDKSVPSVMKFFKSNYGNIVDLKIVQEIMKK